MLPGMVLKLRARPPQVQADPTPPKRPNRTALARRDDPQCRYFYSVGGRAGTRCEEPKSEAVSSHGYCDRHYRHWEYQREKSERLSRAVAELQKLQIRPEITDPKVALLESVSIASQIRDFVVELIKTLEPGDYNAIGGMVIRLKGTDGQTFTLPLDDAGEPYVPNGARAEVFFEMLEKWTKLAGQVSKLALDANIDDRMVKLAQDKHRIIVDAILGGLLDAEVDPLTIERIKVAVAQRLRMLAASTPPQFIPPRLIGD